LFIGKRAFAPMADTATAMRCPTAKPPLNPD